MNAGGAARRMSMIRPITMQSMTAGKEGVRVSDPRWDWADSFTGAVMGAVAGAASVFGWVNKRIGTVHGRINATNERLGVHATDIAVLTAHHQANLQFQARIDQTLQALNVKQDEQMKILVELKGRDH